MPSLTSDCSSPTLPKLISRVWWFWIKSSLADGIDTVTVTTNTVTCLCLNWTHQFVTLLNWIELSLIKNIESFNPTTATIFSNQIKMCFGDGRVMVRTANICEYPLKYVTHDWYYYSVFKFSLVCSSVYSAVVYRLRLVPHNALERPCLRSFGYQSEYYWMNKWINVWKINFSETGRDSNECKIHAGFIENSKNNTTQPNW